jgi:23S rRNA (cytosine1962-C5)-methyltransferase
VPIRFRAPGVPRSLEEILARLAPVQRDRARRGGLHFAHTSGIGGAWRRGPPVRDAGRPLPPGAALWLDAVDAPPEAGYPRELEAWLPALPWSRGRVPGAHGAFSFTVEETQADRSRVRFQLDGTSEAEARDWCERAGAPWLGDVARGGSLALPGEPLFATSGDLRVSAAAARALARGHPWLTRDRESEDEGRFAPGALVELADGQGRGLGSARVEGGPQLVARVWARPRAPGARAAKPPSIEARVAAALARREKLRADPEVREALRWVHGEADGLPGLFADRLGGVLRIQIHGRAALALRDRATAALAQALRSELGREPSVVEVLLLRPVPPGELDSVRLLSGPPVPEEPEVRERALRFALDLGLGDPSHPRPGTGLFLDQRENRARLAALVRPDGRYLNLFAHTGAFSAALLAAGAARVTSVDLSAPYLARLGRNLARNHLPLERHHAIQRDVRQLLAELPEAERFDGIVLDPPTAASAGHHFWSARQGLEALLTACFGRLAPGGFLLASTSDRKARGRLAARAAAAAASAGVRVRIAPAPPAPDFPELAGFPEGAAFEAILAVRLGNRA